MTNFIPPSLKRFKSSIVSCTIFIYPGAIAVAYLVEIFLHGFTDILHHWRAFVDASLIAGLPVCVLYTWILASLYPVAFSSEGIYGYSVWGTKRFLRWEDILLIRKFTLLNLTWLRISSKVSRYVLWLPLFQARPMAFVSEISKFAPADSLIRNFLKLKNT